MLVLGTPSACFIPAAAYRLKEITGIQAVSVPIRGSYPEDSPQGGAFDVCPEPGLVLFGTLLQTLFAFKAYPALLPGQLFALSGVEINEEDNKVVVIGRVLEFVEAKSDELFSTSS